MLCLIGFRETLRDKLAGDTGRKREREQANDEDLQVGSLVQHQRGERAAAGDPACRNKDVSQHEPTEQPEEIEDMGWRGREGGRLSIASEALCQNVCSVLWRWGEEVLRDERVRCVPLGAGMETWSHVPWEVPGSSPSASPAGEGSRSTEVSFHLPLHRFLIAAISEVLRMEGARDLNLADEIQRLLRHSCAHHRSEDVGGATRVAAWRDAGFDSESHAFVMLLVEYPLRVLVAAAEGHVGMWVRNGMLMSGQAACYTGPHFCQHMFQLDISSLQLASCVLHGSGKGNAAGGAGQLMAILLEKFHLRTWVYGGGKERDATAIDNEKKVGLLGELLTLIIMVLCERSLVAPASEEEDVRMFLLHRLAIGASTQSNLVKALPPRIAEHPLKDKVLGEVAHFRAPTATRSGEFGLKPEFLCRVNAFSCHLSRRDRQSVLERLHAAAQGKDLVGVETNKPQDSGASTLLALVTFPPLPACLAPLVELLVSPTLWHLLATVLDTACDHLSGSSEGNLGGRGREVNAFRLDWVNDACMQQTLHLIALAMSAADQDKENGCFGGTLWTRLTTILCDGGGLTASQAPMHDAGERNGQMVFSMSANGEAESIGVHRPNETGENFGRRTRRSVVQSLVFLQTPIPARESGEERRFQRDLHEQLVHSIVHTLCEASEECRRECARVSASTLHGCEEGGGVGGDGERAEERKKRQMEAKERMMRDMKEKQAQALAAMMMDLSGNLYTARMHACLYARIFACKYYI